jgi:hypothetical protein
MSNMFLRFAATSVLACGVLMLAGCPKQTTTVSASQNSKTGTTVTVSHQIVWDPAGSDLVGFDATQALLNLSLTNATITSTSGTVILGVKDLTTGQIVGQQTFGYVVNGNSLYAQDPTAVYNWLQQFTSYASIDVIVNVDTDVDATSVGGVSSTGNAQYQGITYASATVSWTYSGGTGGGDGCTTRICPNQ